MNKSELCWRGDTLLCVCECGETTPNFKTHEVFRETGLVVLTPSAFHRSQRLLQLAHDPSGVLQWWVCGRLRHPSADAPERRPGGGAEEAGHPLCSAGRRERIQVMDRYKREAADSSEGAFIRLNPHLPLPPPPSSTTQTRTLSPQTKRSEKRRPQSAESDK